MLSFEDASVLFRAGEFSEVARRWRSAKNDSPEVAVRLLVAHSLVVIGDTRVAEELINHDLGSGSALIRSRASVVRGLINQADGALTLATQQLNMALKLAIESKDANQIAWASVHLMTHLINVEPRQVVMAMLPDVRRAVTRAGDPHATAYLHQAIAVLEAQTGGLDEARRHCDLVDAMLSIAPNCWLASNTLMNRACLDLVACRYDSAVRHIEQARKVCVSSGLARGIAVAEGNLAHALFHTGAFGRAIRSFDKTIDSPQSSTYARLGALEGKARVYLALGELDACRVVLSEIDAVASKDEKNLSHYHVRWSAVTKARLALKRGDAAQAIEILLAVEDVSQRTADRPLEAATNLTLAQAYAAHHDWIGAATRLLDADLRTITQHPEMQASFYLAASTLTSGELSDVLSIRAAALWARQGIVSMRREIEPISVMPTPNLSGSRLDSVAATVNSLGSALDLGHTPEILARQLSETLSKLGLASSISLEANSKERDALSLDLGGTDSRRVILRCSAPTDPTQALILGDMLRIGRAAVTLERLRLEDRNRAALWPADRVETEAGALFLADEMQALLTTARRIAPTNVPVLITGETGTGKEVLARLIHAYSPRSRATFLPFNCSAVPRDMLDSQLFGHRRGSFTGAAENFPGVIRGAANGTLFLDEIGETTLDVQPKLLRFLESSEVHPIGELHPARVDVRVIAATNADLDNLVTDGRFREDLFYRLNIVRLHIPPLRERRVEIPALAHHYLAKHAIDYGKGDLRLSEETMEYLVLYRWPGNVRQLANEMRRLAALAESGAVLMPEHLSHEIASSRRTIPASERTLEPIEVVVRLDQPMAAAVQHLERSLILYALKQTGANMEQTAAMLGLSRKGLYLKRQRYAIEIPGETPGIAVA